MNLKTEVMSHIQPELNKTFFKQGVQTCFMFIPRGFVVGLLSFVIPRFTVFSPYMPLIEVDL